MGIHGTPNGNQSIIITSTSGLQRASKASRDAYYPMFKPKAVTMDLDRLVVIVQDFNFDYFCEEILFKMKQDAWNKFLEWPFQIRLTFTEDFLYEPSDESIKRWLSTISDDGWPFRCRKCTYAIDPIPNKYVEPIHEFLNGVIFARGGKPGPELTQIMDDIWKRFESREIYKDKPTTHTRNSGVITNAFTGENDDIYD